MNKKNLLTKIKEIASGVMSLETDEVIAAEAKDAPVIDLTLAQETMDSGAVLEAEVFEAGQGVFIVNEDERIPVPVGEYEWDGKMLIVTEEGMIGEIVDAMVEEPEAEVEAEAVYVTVEQFNEAIDEIKSMFSKQIKDAGIELEKEKGKVVELQKEIDETPDAVATKHQPKEKVALKQERATTKKGRITQLINNKKNK